MRGTVLADRYRLVDWLGGGSMGDVWLAEDEVLGRRVAVKVVKPALLDEPGFAERFHAEARVMARLRHPGIVGVYDYGHDRGTGHDHDCGPDAGSGDDHGPDRGPDAGSGVANGRRPVGYLVMELIEGQPLSAVLERRGALPVAEALELVLQVLEALEAAHGSGVVHRDIKPANLMVRGDRTVIADFGIARPDCDARTTVPGMVLGTAAYQAPEQASTGTVTASADLYALGVVLYECLAGRLPYEGETALEVILKHLTEPVPPLPGEVPAPVWALVERAMAKEPGERWPDAATMATAARRALTAVEAAPSPGPSPSWTGSGTGPRPVAARAPRTGHAARTGRAPRTGHRLRALAGVTALTLLCVAGAAGAAVVRPDRNGAPQDTAAVAGPTDGPARPDAAAFVEAAGPLTGQPSAPAALPLPPPPAVPGTGESPAPAPAAPAPTTRSPFATPPAPASAVPTRGSAPLPVPASTIGENPAAPAPTPTAPDRPDPGETATPTPSATPTQPTRQPVAPLPELARISSNGGTLDNSYSKDQDGNQVDTFDANGTLAQVWRLDKVDEGRYYLRNASSNFTKGLDQDRDSGRVQIWTSPPSNWNQVWAITPVPGGHRIVNADTSLCLTSDGVGHWVRVAPCSGADNQVWTLR
ncbi:protein kinase [Kitasatospora sp. NPDC006786]|uniref:serine/threonine protein kinase n=1 Tax=unclassified Kitasatospora TaxID=2633591 RepID=UPI00340FFBE0